MEDTTNNLMAAFQKLVEAFVEEADRREQKVNEEIQVLKAEIEGLKQQMRLKADELTAAQAALAAAEEEAARKAAEEEAARKAAEEEAARKAAEEEAARKAAEEEAARKAAEEEAARKAAEEEAARKAAEEEAARKAAEEEAARKAAEEEAARKAAEEEAAMILESVESEEPLFAPEEKPQEPQPVPPAEIEIIDGHPYKAIFEEPAKPEKNPEPAKQPSLFDYLGGGQQSSTLADRLAGNRPNLEEQLESRVAQKKVDDLRTIININDKFSFMNELFHNNMKAYSDFILKLNAAATREAGLAIADEAAAANQWDENSLAVRTFYKYFDRKF